MFLQEADFHQMKTADQKHIDPRLAGTRKLMILTPNYLTTNQSEKCPQADFEAFL